MIRADVSPAPAWEDEVDLLALDVDGLAGIALRWLPVGGRA